MHLVWILGLVAVLAVGGLILVRDYRRHFKTNRFIKKKRSEVEFKIAPHAGPIEPDLMHNKFDYHFADEDEIVIKKTSESLSSKFSVLEEEESFASAKPVKGSEQEQVAELTSKLIVMHVRARDLEFSGRELLHTLLAAGLRFGDMMIFHRFSKPNGQGRKLFSIASMVKPGTFPINKINNFSTPGLTLFFDLQAENMPIYVYDLMLQTARRLAQQLDGEVWDEEHELLTAEKVEKQRLNLTILARQQEINRDNQVVNDEFDTSLETD